MNLIASSVKNKLIAVIAVATFVHWVVLGFHVPLFSSLPGWFWKFTPELDEPVWSVCVLVFLVTGTIFVAVFMNGAYAVRLGLIFIMGVGFQFGFASLEGRGTDAVKDRIIDTGHAEFAEVAVQYPDIAHLMVNYEYLLDNNELGLYANSKPPGTLAFYVFTHKLAVVVYGKKDGLIEKLYQLRDLATILWPIISCFVVLPIYLITRDLFDEVTGLLASSLYVFVPSVNLITLHTDQVIFPLLFITSIWVSLIAARRDSLLISFISGVFTYFSVWFTFSLIFVVPFSMVIMFFIYREGEENHGYNRLLKLFLCLFVGLFTSDLVLRYMSGYDIVLRFQKAAHFHAEWKSWMWKDWSNGFITETYFGVLNLLDYLVWLGVPLSVFLILAIYDSIKSLMQNKKLSLETAQPVLLLGMLILFAFFSSTRGESARLWLFLTAFTCLVVAYFITRRLKNFDLRLVAPVMLLQFVTIYFIKANQDFW